MPPISRKQHILDSLSHSDNSSTSCSDSRSPFILNPLPSPSSSSSPSCVPSRSDYERRSGPSTPVILNGSQYARVNRVILDKSSDEYRKRRERNNIAVKKSRTKSKIKTIQTLQQVNLLKAENDFLSRKVEILSRELRVLKDIFMSHASNAHGTRITEYDLKLLTGGSEAMESSGPTIALPAIVPTFIRDPHSPEPMASMMRDPLYSLSSPSSSSHRRYPASLSLSSGSSIQDSEDDL